MQNKYSSWELAVQDKEKEILNGRTSLFMSPHGMYYDDITEIITDGVRYQSAHKPEGDIKSLFDWLKLMCSEALKDPESGAVVLGPFTENTVDTDGSVYEYYAYGLDFAIISDNGKEKHAVTFSGVEGGYVVIESSIRKEKNYRVSVTESRTYLKSEDMAYGIIKSYGLDNKLLTPEWEMTNRVVRIMADQSGPLSLVFYSAYKLRYRAKEMLYGVFSNIGSYDAYQNRVLQAAGDCRKSEDILNRGIAVFKTTGKNSNIEETAEECDAAAAAAVNTLLVLFDAKGNTSASSITDAGNAGVRLREAMKVYSFCHEAARQLTLIHAFLSDYRQVVEKKNASADIPGLFEKDSSELFSDELFHSFTKDRTKDISHAEYAESIWNLLKNPHTKEEEEDLFYSLRMTAGEKEQDSGKLEEMIRSAANPSDIQATIDIALPGRTFTKREIEDAVSGNAGTGYLIRGMIVKMASRMKDSASVYSLLPDVLNEDSRFTGSGETAARAVKAYPVAGGAAVETANGATLYVRLPEGSADHVG